MTATTTTTTIIVITSRIIFIWNIFYPNLEADLAKQIQKRGCFLEVEMLQIRREKKL